MEQLDYNLLFRWFVGLAMDAPVWDATVFTKNRDRFLEGEVAAQFFEAVLGQAEVKALLSDEHFTVDGTLIEAWASMKSFKPKAEGGGEPPAGGGRNAERDFHGEKRSNDTPRLDHRPGRAAVPQGPRQGGEALPMGHLLMENRNGLIVDAMLTPATGTAEREAAEAMLGRQPGRHRITLGADKAYDTAGFVAGLRALNVTRTSPRTRPAGARRSTLGPRAIPAMPSSQRVRKRIEEAFGWIKTVGGLRKTRHRGTARVGWLFTLTATACNLVRLPKLLAAG